MKMLQLIIGGMILLSCSNTPTNDNNTETNNNTGTNDNETKKTETKTPVSWVIHNSGSQSSVSKPLNTIITSQEELNSIWSKSFSMGMTPEKPAVDFSKKSVVILFLGTVNNGGHAVEIDSIINPNEGAYIIEAKHNMPGKNCMSSMAIESPYIIAIANAKIATNAKFNIKDNPKDCE